MNMDLSEQYDKIYRYCYEKLRRRESAEDVTQETFLRFYRSYAGRERTLQLLYTIARNLCADEWRRRPELPLEDAEDIPQEEFFCDGGPDLRAALEKLAPEDRELLLLRCVNEVPWDTLSALYGVSRFALSRRLRALLAGLKRELEG